MLQPCTDAISGRAQLFCSGMANRQLKLGADKPLARSPAHFEGTAQHLPLVFFGCIFLTLLFLFFVTQSHRTPWRPGAAILSQTRLAKAADLLKIACLLPLRCLRRNMPALFCVHAFFGAGVAEPAWDGHALARTAR